MSLLYQIGAYGPFILNILSWYLLWNSQTLFFYYTLGVVMNIFLNIILKGFIQEPRPIFDTQKVSLAVNYSKHFFYQNGVPFDMFGMPSGHAQGVFFSTMFVYLTLKNGNIRKMLYIYLIIILLTCYHRIHSNYHSISQVVVGAMVGSAFAYFVFTMSQNNLRGFIREKPDDMGPL
jgi:hypothetical protein